MAVRKYIRQSLRYGRWRVEGSEDRLFQTVHQLLVFTFVLAVLSDKSVQLHCRSKQLKVRLCPMDGIRQFLGRVQYALQAAKAAVAFQ